MKLTFYFQDGHEEIVENAMPSFMEGEETSEWIVGGISDQSESLTDDVPISLLTKVVWEA